MNTHFGTLFDLGVIFGSWLLVTGSIWKLFERAEKVAAPIAKESAKEWINNFQLTPAIQNWAMVFSHMIDALFGCKPLSWKFFFRSCFASYLATFVVICIWAALHPDELLAFLEGDSVFKTFSLVLSGTLIINIIPDYISLIESRWLIRWVSRTKGDRIFLFLLIDTFATLAVIVIMFGVLNLSFGGDVSRLWEVLTQMAQLSSKAPGPGEADGLPTGIWFYSTFFTSVWVWLFLSSKVVLRYFKKLDRIIAAARGYLDIDSQPFLSLATISIAIVTMLYILITLVNLMSWVILSA